MALSAALEGALALWLEELPHTLPEADELARLAPPQPLELLKEEEDLPPEKLPLEPRAQLS
jgi:hypothetical protein